MSWRIKAAVGRTSCIITTSLSVIRLIIVSDPIVSIIIHAIIHAII